jgi:hypothetical protein
MDLTSKWFIALYGWAGLNIIIFWIQKQKADKSGQDFNYWNFFKTHVDDWAVTLFFVVPVVSDGPDIHKFTMQILNYISPVEINIPWYNFFYAGPGLLAQTLYWLTTTLIPALKRAAMSKVEALAGALVKKSPAPVVPPTNNNDEVS